MGQQIPIICIIGPTGSGKSARAVSEALERGGEVISVDSRQVYRMLDIGTEKITQEEMRGVPHHLIDIRDPKDKYSAGEFVEDADKLIMEIYKRGKIPILAGGTHFYFDALLHGIPGSTPMNEKLREELEKHTDEELYAMVQEKHARRAEDLDPRNRRRLIRALEIIEQHGKVPERGTAQESKYKPEWIVVDVPREELRKRLDARLESAFKRGLIEEVTRIRNYVGDTRLNEFGLEYKVVGEYIRGERTERSLLPTLSMQLWHYARRQKAWLRKLTAHIPRSDSR